MGTSLQISLVKQIMIHMSHIIHMQSSLLMFKANFRITISPTRNAGKYTLEGRLSYQICMYGLWAVIEYTYSYSCI